jgi:hypothetical protein
MLCSPFSFVQQYLLLLFQILKAPIQLNQCFDGFRANILGQMAGITLLLKRAFSFIVRVTNRFRKSLKAKDPRIKETLTPPSLPKSIRNIIQLE